MNDIKMNDVKMNDVKEIQSILESIRNKRKTIQLQTSILKSFNLKMEILLQCFEAYSNLDFKGELDLKSNERLDFKGDLDSNNNKRLDSNNNENASNTSKNISNNTSKNIPNNTSNNTTNNISTSPSNNILNDPVALKLYQFIDNKENVTLDEIVKSMKYSKYKIIEILNIFIKEKIVLKSFDKGFVYKINK